MKDEQIPPWLRHLKRDRRGIPVPWVNRWGPEDPATLRIEHDPHVCGPAIFIPDVGDTPDFTKQSPQRQRQAMATGLCQVCGTFVPWSRRLLIASTKISLETIELEGQQRVVITEPWLDVRCAQFALEYCPGLIRRRTADDLALITVTSKREVTLVRSMGYVDGPLFEESMRVQPIMWCKVAPRMPVGVGV